jgi:hypothetical protein
MKPMSVIVAFEIAATAGCAGVLYRQERDNRAMGSFAPAS